MLFNKEELREFLNYENQKHGSNNEAKVLIRAEFEQWLKTVSDELKEVISSNSLLDPALKDERIKKAKFDFLYFAKTYFPHYFTIKGECELHTYLATLFEDTLQKENGSKNAIAAPRGHAKTTYSSILLPLWAICFNKRKFIVELSDSVELVDGILESIKAELEENPNLKADFPLCCGIGKMWRIGEFITNNGVKVQSFGTGKRVRGIRYGIYRPDLVIADDLENDTNVRSRSQRDKLEDWLDEAVSNLGSLEDKLIIIYIGTILHQDSVLNRKIKSPFWNSKVFKSIINYPKRMDLWEKWEQLFKSYGEKHALKFYEDNEALMLDGSQVLWEEALPLIKLMKKRAENRRSFDKEQQNTPLSENAIFKQSNFHYYTNAPKCDFYYMYVDPAGGKKKGDFTSITVLGVHIDSKKIYVCENISEKLAGNDTIKRVIKLQELYKCRIVAIETNGGQFFLKEWLYNEAFDNSIKMPLKGVNNSTNKGIRIGTLEIPVATGEILLHKTQTTLINQLLDYPEAEHDDAPDSLAGAYDLCKGGKDFKRKRREHGFFKKFIFK
ncbi:putative phage protein [Campylobacter blaseri]|uniref:Terminase large subunit gp17-like C-terminal domain-containing protein n=1 Tax=Campylobacter blaseri TaxID=2042961 RepID=A0A2P8QYM6_9BACT|nr:phage terminase large subunit [Campylobacter blaseri]PSM51348.1 hypothetical protein CQ405_08135 [Campylobacter blaseri]PSM52798.1 hypothetical protein CRN67_08140 [Campylobacter blaseri]QKF86098.1 putative phage protein [Campylobacter blaseri]